MTKRVKVYGAGSIGNHLTQASRRMGWDVTVVDIDPDALKRMREDIYPTRYGKWDDSIQLLDANDAKAENNFYDLVMVGTPPDSHIPIALEAIEKSPSAILIEKPICGPDLDGIEELREKSAKNGVRLFVGYDHAVSPSVMSYIDLLNREKVEVTKLEVFFQEHWGGIFAAHPWLAGPWESYLGFTARGGGALGEHSHGINLWLTLARELGAGRVRRVSADIAFVQDGRVDYDEAATLTLETDQGLRGRCIQDVITEPSVKSAQVYSVLGKSSVSFTKDKDTLDLAMANGNPRQDAFPKSRPDDFFYELKEIERVMDDPGVQSNIDAEYGFETMMVIAAALRSAKTGGVVAIDYEKGYHPEALTNLE